MPELQYFNKTESLKLFKKIGYVMENSDLHPEKAKVTANLDVAYFAQGCYSKAEGYLIDAIDLYNKLGYSNHPDIAKPLNQLAMVHLHKLKIEDAKNCCDRASEIFIRNGMDNTIAFALMLNDRGEIFRERNEPKKSIEYYDQALDILSKCLKENYLSHPDVVKISNNKKLALKSLELINLTTINQVAIAYENADYGNLTKLLFEYAKDLYKQQYFADDTKLYYLIVALLKKCIDEPIGNTEPVDNQVNQISIAKAKKIIKKIECSLVQSITGNFNPICGQEQDDATLKNFDVITHAARSKLENHVDVLHSFNQLGLLERAFQINAIYKTIKKDLYRFITSLIDLCRKIIGDPPDKCSYSFIALGSLAKERASPYSDFEWAILIENGKDSTRNIKYFQNLAKLIEIKIIQLGQTAIPKDFFSETGNGITFNFDDLIKPGFQYDLGGKTPLGRRDKDYLLIKPPDKMLEYLSDEYFQHDKFLPIILMNFDHLYGQQNITKIFCDITRSFLEEVIEGIPRYIKRALTFMSEGSGELTPDLEKYNLSLTGIATEAEFYNIKQEIYRLPDRWIEGLTLYHGVIDCGSLRKKIIILLQRSILTSAAKDNLIIAEAIAAEIRLRVNLHYCYQSDRIGVLINLSDQNIENTKDLFWLKDIDSPERSLLFNFYYRAIPLQDKLVSFFYNSEVRANFTDFFARESFFNDSALIKGKIFVRIMRFNDAIEYVLKSGIDKRCLHHIKIFRATRKGKGHAIHNLISDLLLLVNCYQQIGNVEGQIKYCKKALIFFENIATIVSIPKTKKGRDNSDEYLQNFIKILQNNHVVTLHNLGIGYQGRGDYNAAVVKMSEALKIYTTISKGQPCSEIADTQLSLGTAHSELSEWHWEEENSDEIMLNRKIARQHFENAEFYYRSTSTPSNLIHLAKLLCNFSNLNFIESNHKAAIEQLHEALKLANSYLGENHPIMAQIFSSLGKLFYTEKLDGYKDYYDEAIIRYERLMKLKAGNIYFYISIIQNLANILIYTDKYDQAEKYLSAISSECEKLIRTSNTKTIHDKNLSIVRTKIRLKLLQSVYFFKMHQQNYAIQYLIEALELFSGQLQRAKSSFCELRGRFFSNKNISAKQLFNGNWEAKAIIMNAARNASKNGQTSEAIKYKKLVSYLFNDDQATYNRSDNSVKMNTP